MSDVKLLKSILFVHLNVYVQKDDRCICLFTLSLTSSI